MKRTHALGLCAILLMGCTSCHTETKVAESPELKPRLVVMTDIGPGDVEPDDNQSAIRLLAYADRFEIEALITTVGWNCDPYPTEWAEYLHGCVEAYGEDVTNLMKRSAQTGFLPLEEEEQQTLGYWPSVEYVRSRVLMGSQRAGIGVIGPENDTEGSRRIIELVDEPDPRPIYFCAWGSANTLAQAVWRVQQERTPEELQVFLSKVRLYTITDQDMVYQMRMNRAYSSHQWLRREFAESLQLIWDESAWLNQVGTGRDRWEEYATLIQGHGALGRFYPKYLWGVEGDSPSFFHCMPNGLNDPSDPTQIGWGGVHHFGISPDSVTMAWTNWQQPLKDISDAYEKNFYQDIFNDFAARMQWAAEGTGTTNPVVIVNDVAGIEAIEIEAKPGETITLDASKSYDPEGDALTFSWWQQVTTDGQDLVAISDSQSDKTMVTIPANCQEREIHVICEVHDTSTFSLVSYRRIIIKPTQRNP